VKPRSNQAQSAEPGEGTPSRQCLLSELGRGECGVVCGLVHSGATSQRLQALGLLPGCELKFLRNAPLGDPMMVETSSGVICLRRREAALVQVLCTP
jgi:ferrous iron transport protein A